MCRPLCRFVFNARTTHGAPRRLGPASAPPLNRKVCHRGGGGGEKVGFSKSKSSKASMCALFSTVQCGAVRCCAVWRCAVWRGVVFVASAVRVPPPLRAWPSGEEAVEEALLCCGCVMLQRCKGMHEQHTRTHTHYV